MRSLLIALTIALSCGCAAAAESALTIASGDYGDGMLIGFDPSTKAVRGYFSSETGQGRFNCIFYLKGRLSSSPASISTYFPETPNDKINGKLLVKAHDSVLVRLSTEPGGCWNVLHFADDDQPAEFTLVAKHPWVSIAVIKSDRAYFFDAPAASVHRKAYLVQGDAVGVRGVQPGWLQVDFVGGRKMVSGWVRQSDVYPDD